LDIETNKPVGDVPNFEEIIDWYSKHLPDEKKTGLRIVHGDYKMGTSLPAPFCHV
jgi:aminoglycoside phosphotransferase (APT) family kinase protein